VQKLEFLARKTQSENDELRRTNYQAREYIGSLLAEISRHKANIHQLELRLA
jgi:hypothetical protein